jgi:hypothetical protein
VAEKVEVVRLVAAKGLVLDVLLLVLLLLLLQLWLGVHGSAAGKMCERVGEVVRRVALVWRHGGLCVLQDRRRSCVQVVFVGYFQ